MGFMVCLVLWVVVKVGVGVKVKVGVRSRSVPGSVSVWW